MAETLLANEVAEAVVENTVGQGSVTLPSKISINAKAVAAGAGIALGLIGLGVGTYLLVNHIKKTVNEKKAANPNS